MSASRLSAMLLATPDVLPGMSQTDRSDRVKHRVGTVHRSQGMEAEAVILMLGPGRGAKAGSQRWAGATPNLLKVAATRAKRVLHIVGTWTEWQSAGVFAGAVEALDIKPPPDWLRLDYMAPAP